MDLLNLQEIKNYLSSLQKDTAGHFKGINFNNNHIYIAAGNSNFCSPRANFSSLSHYTHIQMGIYETVRSVQRIISPLNDERYKNFAWAKYFVYLDNKNTLSPSYMGKEIPLNIASQLIKDVYKMSRLKAFF